MHVFWTLAMAAVLTAQPGAQTACDMSRTATAGDGTPILASTGGEPAVFFRSNLDVNTDGTARSYHPDDPRAKTKALNNMGNAITGLYDSAGRSILCKPRSGACFTRFMEVFEESRDAGWDRVGHRWFTTDYIIPWRRDAATGRLVPCTIKAGPYAGYFVSMTSRKIDPAKDDCDQSAWIDSLALNAVVLPGNAKWASQGKVAREFVVAAVRNRANGAIRFAVVGDRGPASTLGEGSIALAAALRDVAVPADATYKTIRALALANADYVLFPAIDANAAPHRPMTQARIDALAGEAFARWGGAARLDACAR